MADQILVIEDDTTIRVTLRDVLQRQGYQVDLAEDGKGGLEHFRTRAYGLTLLDLHLPDMHGLEVLKAIRAAREAGATVFFSSHVLSEVETIADRVGIIRRGEVVEVADTQALIARAMRRVSVRFKHPIDLAALAALPGVTVVSHNSVECQLHVTGDMDSLIKTLAVYPVSELEIERASLEEIFLTYYNEARP